MLINFRIPNPLGFVFRIGRFFREVYNWFSTLISSIFKPKNDDQTTSYRTSLQSLSDQNLEEPTQQGNSRVENCEKVISQSPQSSNGPGDTLKVIELAAEVNGGASQEAAPKPPKSREETNSTASSYSPPSPTNLGVEQPSEAWNIMTQDSSRVNHDKVVYSRLSQSSNSLLNNEDHQTNRIISEKNIITNGNSIVVGSNSRPTPTLAPRKRSLSRPLKSIKEEPKSSEEFSNLRRTKLSNSEQANLGNANVKHSDVKHDRVVGSELLQSSESTKGGNQTENNNSENITPSQSLQDMKSNDRPTPMPRKSLQETTNSSRSVSANSLNPQIPDSGSGILRVASSQSLESDNSSIKSSNTQASQSQFSNELAVEQSGKNRSFTKNTIFSRVKKEVRKVGKALNFVVSVTGLVVIPVETNQPKKESLVNPSQHSLLFNSKKFGESNNIQTNSGKKERGGNFVESSENTNPNEVKSEISDPTALLLNPNPSMSSVFLGSGFGRGKIKRTPFELLEKK